MFLSLVSTAALVIELLTKFGAREDRFPIKDRLTGACFEITGGKSAGEPGAWAVPACRPRAATLAAFRNFLDP
jgi:hypothetical protein